MFFENHPEGNYRRAFLILLIATTVFRLSYIRWVDLAPDEAYYWTWSHQLQWGYLDHPPMIGFLIWLTTAIGGEGEFGVRWGWVIIGALLTFLSYRLGSKMFKSVKVGFFSALLMNIILLAATGAIIATPDGPQDLFWVLTLFFVYKAVEGEGGYWWYLSGIALGLGLLSKYTMILVAPCILFYLLSSGEGRKWLGHKEPYLALLLGLAIFSPVILWNARHDWVSFRFQLSHGLEIRKAVGWKYFGEYWAGQAGVVSPLMFLALIWAMIRSASAGFRHKKNHWLLLFWTSAPILLFFAFTSLRSKVEANWPALTYFSAVVSLAGFTCQEWDRWTKGKKAFAWATAISALVFTFVAHVQPIYTIVPLAAKKDPTSQLYGWRQMGERLKEIARTLDTEKGIFLMTTQHQMVGEGMFYTQGKFPVYQWDAPQRINHLSITHAPPPGSQGVFYAENGKELPRGITMVFDSCEKLETLVIERNSSIVRTIPFWKCVGFRGLRGQIP